MRRDRPGAAAARGARVGGRRLRGGQPGPRPPAGRPRPSAPPTRPLRDALLSWSRQESRLLPRRDFRPVAGQLATARGARPRGGTARRRASRARGARRPGRRSARPSRSRRRRWRWWPRPRCRPSSARACSAPGSSCGRPRRCCARARSTPRASAPLGSRAAMREALGPALAAAERYTLARRDRHLATLDRGDARVVEDDRPGPRSWCSRRRTPSCSCRRARRRRPTTPRSDATPSGSSDTRATTRRPRAATAW